MIKIILFIIASLGAIASQAQNANLSTFATKANAGSEITFTFIATDNKGAEIFNEKGKTQLLGDKFIMEIPNNLLVMSNGTTKWIYKHNDEEIIIAPNNPKEEDILENPFAILQANKEGKIKNYKVAVTQRKTPTAAMQGVPDKIILTAVTGAKYTIIISGFTPKNLSGTKFEMDVKKYPKAVVTDLR